MMSTRNTIGTVILADLALPIAAYYLLRIVGVSDVIALACGAVLSATRVTAVAIRARHLDVAAAVVLGVFALGMLDLLISKDARVALATSSLLTGALGLWCLGSLLVGRALAHWLFLPLLTAGQQDQEAFWHQAWQNAPTYRHALRTVTLGWGCLLFGEAVLRLILVLLLPTDVMVGVSNALQLVLIAAMLGATGWYARSTGLGIRPYLDAIGVGPADGRTDPRFL